MNKYFFLLFIFYFVCVEGMEESEKSPVSRKLFGTPVIFTGNYIKDEDRDQETLFSIWKKLLEPEVKAVETDNPYYLIDVDPLSSFVEEQILQTREPYYRSISNSLGVEYKGIVGFTKEIYQKVEDIKKQCLFPSDQMGLVDIAKTMLVEEKNNKELYQKLPKLIIDQKEYSPENLREALKKLQFVTNLVSGIVDKYPSFKRLGDDQRDILYKFSDDQRDILYKFSDIAGHFEENCKTLKAFFTLLDRYGFVYGKDHTPLSSIKNINMFGQVWQNHAMYSTFFPYLKNNLDIKDPKTEDDTKELTPKGIIDAAIAASRKQQKEIERLKKIAIGAFIGGIVFGVITALGGVYWMIKSMIKTPK